MSNDLVALKLDGAIRALQEAKTIQDTKKILDVAMAAEVYAKRQKLGDEAEGYACAIKVEALRKLGEMLSATPRNKGSMNSGGSKSEPPENVPTLKDIGIDKKTSMIAQRVSKLTERQFDDLKNGHLAMDRAINLASKNTHVSNNSGENEWYTPISLIETARILMGSIDLDPASCELANNNVKAKTFYTKDDDGLSKKWFGNVWLNPPYSQPEISNFCQAIKNFVNDYDQACILVNNATETGWFRDLCEVSSMICLIKNRVKFLDKTGNPSGAPLQGQAMFYVGDNRDGFNKNFKQHGIVVEIW